MLIKDFRKVFDLNQPAYIEIVDGVNIVKVFMTFNLFKYDKYDDLEILSVNTRNINNTTAAIVIKLKLK